MVVTLGIFTWDAIVHEGIEQFRMFTWQSNLVATVFYILITYSYVFSEKSFFRRTDAFRMSVVFMMSLTFFIILFLLGPLWILNYFWGVGPGSMGYVVTGVTWVGALRNIVYHFIAPVFIFWHYFYDKKWKNITTKSSWLYSLPVLSYFLFVFGPVSIAMFFIDGWAPYSIMNPDMWTWGWYAVGIWIAVASGVFLITSWWLVYSVKKLEYI